MKFLLIAVAFAFGVGCTSTQVTPAVVGCSAEQLADTAVIGVLQTVDGCQNTAQMTTDLQALWGSANLCTAAAVQAEVKKAHAAHAAFVSSHKYSAKLKSAASGPIADIVCPIVVNGVDGIIGAKVPAAWNCTGSASIDTALTAACDLLPF